MTKLYILACISSYNKASKKYPAYRSDLNKYMEQAKKMSIDANLINLALNGAMIAELKQAIAKNL